MAPDDIDIVFIPDCEWDVAEVEPIDYTLPGPGDDLGWDKPCVKPWEKRAVQGCFCAKCLQYRSA